MTGTSTSPPPTMKKAQSVDAAHEPKPKALAPASQNRASTASTTSKPVHTKAQPLHPSKNHALQPGQKKVPHRSGKPIINWLQRKWTGTVRSKRTAENIHQEIGRTKGRKGGHSTRSSSRAVSSPLPSPGVNARPSKLEPIVPVRRKTVSLNGDDFSPRSSLSDDRSSLPSSFARDSTYSPIRALEADEDASMRPIPPSAPPSPSPSRSSSSYLSDPHTFKSMAASTKPTTLLSVDLNGGGMAHIAQAPLTPSSYRQQRTAHARTSSTGTNLANSGGSITFSALPPSPTQSTAAGSASGDYIQAPLHTAHHPRNNPRPSSPPIDNASVFTLASSAYAIPGMRNGAALNAWSSAPPSAFGAGDSISHMDSVAYPDGESTSHWGLGDEGIDERDFDASVRALRPRSSRRGSWESEVSRWSARIQSGVGTPSLQGASLMRERSLWTTNSMRTGNPSELDPGEADEYDRASAPGDVEVIDEEEATGESAEKGKDSSLTVKKPKKEDESLLLDVKDTVVRKLSSETIGTPNPSGAGEAEENAPKDSCDTEATAKQSPVKEVSVKDNDAAASPKDKDLLLTPTL
ncbi:hypothetical protein EV121DRAFT_256913 [Schizophyllum commune]